MITIKHLTLTLALMALTSGLCAQVKLGGGFSYGAGPDNLAVQVRGGYEFLPTLTAMIDFNYYLDGVENWRAHTLNFNGQYHFLQKEEFGAYGLAGLNLTRVLNIYGGDSGIRITDPISGVAFNLGAGGQYQFADNLTAFLEVKYIIGDFDQFVAGLGVVYHLDIKKQ